MKSSTKVGWTEGEVATGVGRSVPCTSVVEGDATIDDLATAAWRADCVTGVDSSSKHPEFGMPLNFYDNQGLYAAANKGKSVSLAIEIDKTGLAGSSLSNQVVVYGQNSARNTRIDF
jgi:hypothetical protein